MVKKNIKKILNSTKNKKTVKNIKDLMNENKNVISVYSAIEHTKNIKINKYICQRCNPIKS